MSGDLVQYAYLLSAVLLILGMRNLGSPKTAPRGNLLASLGMAVAVVATLLIHEVVGYWTVFAGMLVGSGIGALLALRIQMTAMPQMVALLNGFGGAASALVSAAELLRLARDGSVSLDGIVPLAIALGVLIGALTFTGSLVAFAKLQELVKGQAVVYPGQRVVNCLLGLLVLCATAAMVLDPLSLQWFYGVLALALLLGVLRYQTDTLLLPANHFLNAGLFGTEGISRGRVAEELEGHGERIRFALELEEVEL